MEQPTDPTQSPSDPRNELTLAHARFARAVLAIYLAVATLALALFVGTLATDLAHQQADLEERLRLETGEREHDFAQHLRLLVQELQRLGLRSEVDLFDENLAPEQRLLNLAHEGSTFFNLGVAILDDVGTVAWTEPGDFLRPGTPLGGEPWFASVRQTRHLQIVAVDPRRADAAVYVVSPIIRGERFAGALLGAIDLARSGHIALDAEIGVPVDVVITTRRGAVVYPPEPPRFSAERAWQELFDGRQPEPRAALVELSGRPTLVSTSPVADTDLLFHLLVRRDVLYQRARERAWTRLGLGLALALVPVACLVLLLRRSMKIFRDSEAELMRRERLRLVGEAANLIAHEVKNSLNGISMAAEIAFSPAPDRAGRSERALREMRAEIARLTEFTGELMTFSKGFVPRKVRMSLGEPVARAMSLLAELAERSGVRLELDEPGEPLPVDVDPALLRIVVSNLVTNAVESVIADAGGGPRWVRVRIGAEGPHATLEVSDSGPGVPARMLPVLFEPFQSGKPSGVGIGLALAKRIAIAHGGDLVLAQGAGRGATFRLTLPRAEV